jgi:3-oxo-5-alpha-steroid 4-dehydrogenase 3 / polyprenol reductase
MMPWKKEGFQNRLVDIDTILALKTFYLATAAAILFAYWILPLKGRFLAYGARSAEHQAGHLVASKDSLYAYRPHPLIILFDFLPTLQVPHSWFITFYCTSVASSMLWGYQLLTLGPLYQEVARWTQRRAASMSHHQIILCWSLMVLQGTRRLWECLVLTKPSQSTMWVFHWLAGILFYIATGMSLWIEGIPALESTNWKSNDILSVLSLRTAVFLPVFLLASILQYQIHVHLASLKKYSLPSHPAFHKIVCPHYTAESILYLALTFLAAPQGHLVNGTMLCATIFVVVNLGVTADISKTWASKKFGKEKIDAKWRILPGLW